MECPHCGCDAVVQDKIGSLEQSTCTECGLVVSDQLFEDDNTNCFFNAPSTGSVPTGVANFMRSAKKTPESISQIGLSEINNIGKALHLDSTMLNESSELYKEACKNEHLQVKHKFRLFKEVLGACCVYVVLRRHEYPITAADMVSLRHFTIVNFIVMLRRFKQHMHIDFPRWSIGQLTAHTLSKVNFSVDVIKRTQQLLLICDKCWLVEGQNPERIIYKAAYFSWISFPNCENGKITYKAFCKLHKFPVISSNDLLTRMKNMLIKMAENIPWIRCMKPVNLRHYISDIVKFKLSLMQKAFCTEKSPNEASESNIDDIPSTYLRKRKRDESDVSDVQDEIDANICAKYGHRLHCTDIGNDEFNDEMELYIKTKKEIEDAKAINFLCDEEK